MDKVGKKFEPKFKEDFEKIGSEAKAIRIYDTESNRLGVRNICDFICYNYPKCFLIECKSHKGNLFPIQSKSKKTGQFEPFRQYPKLLEYKNVKGMVVGVVIWFYEKDKVYFVDIEDLEKMINAEKRSISVNDLYDEKYNIIDIPSVKKRVYMDSDYSVLMNLGGK